MKKMFSNKDGKSPNGKNRAFYIAAVVCGIAIISTGYIVADNMGIRNGKNTAQVKVATPEPTSVPTPVPKQNSVAPVSNTTENVPKPTTKPVVKTEKTQPVAKPVSTLENIALKMPAEGNIKVKHSNDALVYSPTFDDWRTHNGIDIEANESEQVKAAANGIVEKVYIDNMLGIVIEINHGDFKTVYANLSTDSMVKEGKTVKAGDIISGIGSTSISESMQPPHLHFEVIYKDKSVDPEQYIK